MLCGKQMQSADAAAAEAGDDNKAQILPVEANHDENHAAVVAEQSHPIAASHEVLLHTALILL